MKLGECLVRYHLTPLSEKQRLWTAFQRRVGAAAALNNNDRKLLSAWNNVITKQLLVGNKKYSASDDAEWTDIIRHFDSKWIMATMLKYIGRFQVQHREKDLIKIATYAFINWIQDGWSDLPHPLEHDPPISGVRWEHIVDNVVTDGALRDMMHSIYDYTTDPKETYILFIYMRCAYLWKKHGYDNRSKHEHDG